MANASCSIRISNNHLSLLWVSFCGCQFTDSQNRLFCVTDILNENTNARATFPLQNTPVITMVSKGKGTTELVEPDEGLSTERPHASSDGMWVALRALLRRGAAADELLPLADAFYARRYAGAEGGRDAARPTRFRWRRRRRS